LPVVVAVLLVVPVAAVVLVDTEPQLDIRLLLQRRTRQLSVLVAQPELKGLRLVGIPARSVAAQPFSLLAVAQRYQVTVDLVAPAAAGTEMVVAVAQLGRAVQEILQAPRHLKETLVATTTTSPELDQLAAVAVLVL